MHKLFFWYLTALFLCLSLSCRTHATEGTQSMTTDLSTALEVVLSDTVTPGDVTAMSAKASEALSPKAFFTHGFESLYGTLHTGLSLLTPLLAVILASAILDIFTSHLGTSGTLLDFACLLGGVTLVLDAVSPVIQTVELFLEDQLSWMTAANTSIGLLLTSSGEVSTAAASGSANAFSIVLTQVLSIGIVLPCARTVLALGILGTFTKSMDISGVISFLKSFCTWGLGVLFALFGCVQAVALRASTAADTSLLRGIRFSAARLIPVAGNMLSESFHTVLAGIQLIKSTTGVIGIAYLLYMLIPPLCSVLCLKLSILCGTFCARLVGVRKLCSFLDSVGAALNILIAICLFASVGGIVSFAVLLQTSVSL